MKLGIAEDVNEKFFDYAETEEVARELGLFPCPASPVFPVIRYFSRRKIIRYIYSMSEKKLKRVLRMVIDERFRNRVAGFVTLKYSIGDWLNCPALDGISLPIIS